MYIYIVRDSTMSCEGYIESIFRFSYQLNRELINGRRIYPFNKGLRIYGGGVYHPPFDTLKINTSTDDMSWFKITGLFVSQNWQNLMKNKC